MTKRNCAYCLFEIPWNATVCGHCGRDNEYRWSTRTCQKHGIVYDVNEYVNNTDVFKEKCPQCTTEETDRKNRIDQARAPLEKKIKEEEMQRARLYSKLSDSMWHDMKGGEVFKAALAMAVVAAVVSLGVAPLLAVAFPKAFTPLGQAYASFGQAYEGAFALVYGGGWAIAIWRFFAYESLREEYLNCEKPISALRDELSRIK